MNNMLWQIIGWVIGVIGLLAQQAYAAPPQGVEEPRLVVQTGHSSLAQSFVFSPDGKRVVSGSQDKTLKLWDVATGKELRTFIGHSDAVISVAISQDSKIVASGSKDKTLKLWDVYTGKELCTIELEDLPGNLAFTPNGMSIASTNPGILWNVLTCKKQKALGMTTTSVSFSSDGTTMLCAGNGPNLWLRDVATGKKLQTFRGHSEHVSRAILSPDGTQALSLSLDYTLKLWDVATGRELHTFSGDNIKNLPIFTISQIAFSQDGKSLILASDDFLTIVDVATQTLLKQYSLDGSLLLNKSFAFSPDGKMVLYSTYSDAALIDIATGEKLRIFAGEPFLATNIVFAPNGNSVLLQHHSKHQLWDLKRASAQFISKNAYSSTISSSDSKVVLLGEKDLKLLDVTTRQVLRTFSGHSDLVASVAFSPDGRVALSGSLDKTIKLWDVATGKELRAFIGHSDKVDSVTFSPDGKMVLSESMDKTLKLWDVATGKEIYSRPEKFIAFSQDSKTILLDDSLHCKILLWDWATNNSYQLEKEEGDFLCFSAPPATFTPDGKFVMTRENGQFGLYDKTTGKKLRTFGDGNISYFAGFSPDGKVLVSRNNDGTLTLWNTSTGQDLRTIGGCGDIDDNHIIISPNGEIIIWLSDQGAINLCNTLTEESLTLGRHKKNVNKVMFSSDGRTLASGSEDGTFTLWDVATGKKIRTHNEHTGEVIDVVFSPDGKSIVSGSLDQTLILWDVSTGKKLRTFGGYGGYNITFFPDGKSLMFRAMNGSLGRYDIATGNEQQTFPAAYSTISKATISADGKFILSAYVTDFAFDDLINVDSNKKGTNSICTIEIWDVKTGNKLNELKNYKCFFNYADSAFISKDSNTAILINRGNNIELLELSTGRLGALDIPSFREVAFTVENDKIATLNGGNNPKPPNLWSMPTGKNLLSLNWSFSNGEKGLNFSPDGSSILTRSKDSTIKLWDAATGKILRTFTGHSSKVISAVYSPDGKMILSGSEDGSTKLWRISDGTLLASLYSFNDGSWVITDPEGRFDTANLEEIKGLHWIMPDDPLTPVPLEAFMKEYYEPRLLTRILNGEKFSPVPKLMDKNRAQPDVKIVEVKPDPSNVERVNVTIEVAGNKKGYQRDGKSVKMNTAAYDLQLFRDGQLVGYRGGKIVEQGVKPAQITFSVRLPSHKAGQDIIFSTYAFNDDRVKSNTVRTTWHVPATLPAHKGRAYIISIGVNDHDNPDWNLKFAANDARLFQQSVASKLASTNQYQETISITILSDGAEHKATKETLHAILDRLAGKPGHPTFTAILENIQGANKLQTATPDDLILITFSGHGFADDSGNFYLINRDTGTKRGKDITDALKQNSISSIELTDWLRDIDAGDIAMIVDACQSAASVGSDFKPGPMGSRGLGQLAFDKGMRILAASQRDQYALETEKTQHGLLTYALVREGLQQVPTPAADFKPQDGRIQLSEWLNYGTERVPDLYRDYRDGKLKAARTAIPLDEPEGDIQQPALFDFARGRDVVLGNTGRSH